MIIGVDIRVLGTGRRSGIEEYTEQLLAHLIPLDPSVRYKLFSAGRQPIPIRDWMRAPNVELHNTGRSNRALWLKTRLTGRPYIDEMVGGAEVFFFPHFLLGATSRNCRRVMTWHDLSYERMPHLLSWGRRLWHWQMRPRHQVRTADRIIAVSASTARDIESMYGIAPDRITMVHSGIHPDMHRPDERTLHGFRVRTGLPERFILTLGTREPRKNLAAVVRAFDMLASRFPEHHLVIAGADGWHEEALRRAIASSPVRDRIHTRGPVPQEQRASLISLASVVAYPSWLEGFGFPPLEAMACGTPVVASATSAVAEICGDAVLLVHPSSIDGIAEAIAAVLGDAALRQRLREAGKERALRFSWQKAAEQTLSVLTRAAI